MDIGSKTEIVEIVREFADRGRGVLVISSEPAELFALSDRILVMAGGRVVREISSEEIESWAGKLNPRSPSNQFDGDGPASGHPGGKFMNAKSEAINGKSENFVSRLKEEWRQYVIYLGFVVIFISFSLNLSDKGFLDPNNLLNIVRQTTMIAVMAVAMTFVLSSGEFDLAIGAVAGLVSVTTAMSLAKFGLGGIIGGLLTGVVVGLVNGLLTTRVGIPSFLVTLAMMGIARGTAMWVSNTAAIPILDKTEPFHLRLREHRSDSDFVNMGSGDCNCWSYHPPKNNIWEKGVSHWRKRNCGKIYRHQDT